MTPLRNDATTQITYLNDAEDRDTARKLDGALSFAQVGASGRTAAALIINTLAVVPPLTPNTQRTACRNHVIDQSLRDRHIGLTRYRWIRPVDPG